MQGHGYMELGCMELGCMASLRRAKKNKKEKNIPKHKTKQSNKAMVGTFLMWMVKNEWVGLRAIGRGTFLPFNTLHAEHSHGEYMRNTHSTHGELAQHTKTLQCTVCSQLKCTRRTVPYTTPYHTPCLSPYSAHFKAKQARVTLSVSLSLSRLPLFLTQGRGHRGEAHPQ